MKILNEDSFKRLNTVKKFILSDHPTESEPIDFYDLTNIFYSEEEYIACAIEARRDKEKEKQKEKQAQYPFIASHPDAFLDIFYIKEFWPKKVKFIDVGCGWGWFSALANYFFGFESYGIEYDLESYEKAKSLEKYFSVKFFHGDAFEFDFSDYNFIYFYCPIYDPKIMAELYIHIFSSMKDGIIFSNLTPYKKILSERRIISGIQNHWSRNFVVRKLGKEAEILVQ